MQHLKLRLILSRLKWIIKPNRSQKKAIKRTLKSPIKALQFIK